MNKKVTYEIDFTGRDSASRVASKIVCAVASGQKAASAAIQRVNSELQAPANIASSMASRNKAVLDSVANGAGGVAAGIRAVANDAAASIERLSSQSSNLSELRAEYDRLKQAKTEAYLSGDDRKAFDIDGQLRQIGFQTNKIKSVNAEIEAQKKAAESLSSTYTQTYNQVKQSLTEGAEEVSDYIQLIESQKKVVADLTSK